MDPNCEFLAAEILKAQKAIQSGNKDIISRDYGIESGKMTPDDFVDYMHSRYGTDKDLLKEYMNLVPDDLEAIAKIGEKSDEISTKALETAKELSNPEGIKSAWEFVRKKVRDAINFSVSIIPVNLNSSGKNLLKDFSTLKEMIEVGTTKDGNKVYAGTVQAESWQKQAESMYDEIKNDIGVENFNQFNKGLLILGHLRGQDARKGIRDARNALIKGEIPGEKSAIIKEQMPKLLDYAESILENPKIPKFMDKYFEELDILGRKLVEDGILKPRFDDKGNKIKGFMQNYFHNIVSLETGNEGLFEKNIYGPEASLSVFTKSKEYKNGIEAMLDGHMPASFDFTANAAHYWKQAATALRIPALGRMLKNDPSRFQIGDKDGVFLKQEGKEIPDGFKNLNNHSHLLNGIYVHPSLDKWASKFFNIPDVQKSGLKGILRANMIWKTTQLAGYPFYHGASLARKGLYLGTTHLGLKDGWRLDTMQGEGILGVKNKDPILLKLLEGGMALHQHDAMRDVALNMSFDVNTGKQTRFSKMSNFLNDYLNTGHKFLFQKWHMGIKSGMGMRLAKSDWFQKMASKVGEDQAYKNLASILNDTFGGQNLEAIGRSKLTQGWLQAIFLAPDWQESKIRRIMRSGLSDSPEVRASLQKALTAEAITMVFAQFLLQQVYDKTYGAAKGIKPRSPEESAKDLMRGKFGEIYMGETSEGKQLWLSWAGSENQDMRWAANLFRHNWETWSRKSLLGEERKYKPITSILGKVTAPTAFELAGEVRHKFGPVAGLAAEYASQKVYPDEGPSAFDYSFLPMEIASVINAGRGAFGEPKLQRAAEAAVAVPLGAGLKMKSMPKADKPDTSPGSKGKKKKKSKDTLSMYR